MLEKNSYWTFQPSKMRQPCHLKMSETNYVAGWSDIPEEWRQRLNLSNHTLIQRCNSSNTQYRKLQLYTQQMVES